MPIQMIYKEASTTTKVLVVCDASVKTSNGTSFNDTLVVGPTVYPQLVDLLLKFRIHTVALITEISKMYREIQLISLDEDYHQFVWRERPNEPICDFRMTCVTFGVAVCC